MSSSDQIRKFAESTNAKIKKMSADDIERAKQVLHQVLGEDVTEFQNFTYYQKLGKFQSVGASESAIQKVCDAGLLND